MSDNIKQYIFLAKTRKLRREDKFWNYNNQSYKFFLKILEFFWSSYMSGIRFRLLHVPLQYIMLRIARMITTTTTVTMVVLVTSCQQKLCKYILSFADYVTYLVF